jgi:hypothetical protein
MPDTAVLDRAFQFILSRMVETQHRPTLKEEIPQISLTSAF